MWHCISTRKINLKSDFDASLWSTRRSCMFPIIPVCTTCPVYPLRCQAVVDVDIFVCVFQGSVCWCLMEPWLKICPGRCTWWSIREGRGEARMYPSTISAIFLSTIVNLPPSVLTVPFASNYLPSSVSILIAAAVCFNRTVTFFTICCLSEADYKVRSLIRSIIGCIITAELDSSRPQRKKSVFVPFVPA